MKSIWQETVELPRFPRLQGDVDTDVLIIGGGMAGVLSAYYLRQAGVDCLLVEKGRLCQGTTAHTTAKITAQHGLIYHDMLRRMGIERTQKYLKANQLAVREFARLCQEMECDYEIRDNYVYSVTDSGALVREMYALEKAGQQAAFCEKLPLPIPTAGGIMFPDQAQFHPLKFVAQIVKDMPIYENTFVKKMVGNVAVTDRGRITARSVIVTTHFPFINKHGSYFLKLYQHRSYVLALENAQQLQGMYVDAEGTGMSFRNYGKYLLLGGGGHRTGKQGGNWQELRTFVRQHYPQAGEVCQWAAQDCMSLDDVPYIGHYSGHTGQLFTATGFNKWGMTGSMVAAQLLCDLVQGKENSFSDVFCPSRSVIRPQLFANGFEAVVNLLSFSRKRCPHLGCALKWNSAEHTWDCPCHGSRFDQEGRVLDNPANAE